MELIDRNALANENPCEHCHYKGAGCEYTCGENGHAEHAIWRTIDDAPVIDAVPVVRGHWLTFDSKIQTNKSGLGVFCSACNLYVDNKFDFCPNCGAKMDEEVQDE